MSAPSAKPASLLLTLPIIAVLLTSGCTMPGTDIEIPFISGLFGPSVEQDVSDVVVINSLRAIPDTVVPGQEFRVVAYIENRGTKTIPESENMLPESEKMSVKLYDYCNGLFTITGGTTDSDTAEIELLPFETREVYWKLKANSDIDLKTVCPSDGMKVSVTYPYTSTSLTTITFIEPTEYQRRVEAGTLGSTESYIVAGNGPVRAYLNVEDQQPISTDAGTTVLSLNFENRGQGYPSSVISKSTEEENMQILLESVDTGNINLEEDCKIKTFLTTKLIQDKRKYICEADISDYRGKVPLESTVNMNTKIYYQYVFTKSVKVTVDPKI